MFFHFLVFKLHQLGYLIPGLVFFILPFKSGYIVWAEVFHNIDGILQQTGVMAQLQCATAAQHIKLLLSCDKYPYQIAQLLAEEVPQLQVGL